MYLPFVLGRGKNFSDPTQKEKKQSNYVPIYLSISVCLFVCTHASESLKR